MNGLIELDPGSAIDYANIGSNLRELGHREEAIRLYRIALELDPDIEFARARHGKAGGGGGVRRVKEQGPVRHSGSRMNCCLDGRGVTFSSPSRGEERVMRNGGIMNTSGQGNKIAVCLLMTESSRSRRP